MNNDVNAFITAIVLKDQTIESLNAKIVSMFTKEQLDKAVQDIEAAKDAIILQKGNVIAGLNTSIAELQTALVNKNNLISQLEQNIASLNSNINVLNTTIAAKDQTISILSAKITTMYTKQQLDQAVLAAQQVDMAILSANLNTVFGDMGFVLPGATLVEQITNLTNAIGKLPKGQIDKLKQLLTP